MAAPAASEAVTDVTGRMTVSCTRLMMHNCAANKRWRCCRWYAPECRVVSGALLLVSAALLLLQANVSPSCLQSNNMPQLTVV